MLSGETKEEGAATMHTSCKRAGDYRTDWSLSPPLKCDLCGREHQAFHTTDLASAGLVATERGLLAT